MEIESGLVASQNALVVTAPPRDPQREEAARQQQEQRQNTELPRTQVVVRQSAEAFEQAERFRQQQNATYDQPNSRRGRAALSAYNSLANEQRRAELQQILGVDTYV